MSSTALYKFRLYVTGDNPNSTEAKVNLGAFCRRYLHGRYRIEVVDVSRSPKRALTDGVYLTPSLIKLEPSPVRMIVGTLSNTDSLLRALGLETLVEG